MKEETKGEMSTTLSLEYKLSGGMHHAKGTTKPLGFFFLMRRWSWP